MILTGLLPPIAVGFGLWVWAQHMYTVGLSVTVIRGLIVVAFVDVLRGSLPLEQAKKFKLTCCPRSARSDDGAASLGRGAPAQMEAAAAPTMGRAFGDPMRRLPQAPELAAERRAARRRYRQRRRARSAAVHSCADADSGAALRG